MTAVAVMEDAPAASQARVAPKAVAMAVVHVVKVVVEVGAVDAAAVGQTARLARNANASMPKASPCSPMPTCKARTPQHRSRPDRNNAPTGDLALSVVTAPAVVASATKPVNVASREQMAVQRALQRQPMAAPRTATLMVQLANHANPVKSAADEAVAMAAAPARTVKDAAQVAKDVSPNWDLRTATTRQIRRQTTSQPLRTTTALQRRATRTASPARSATATATAVNAAPVVNAKSALTCASRHSLPLRRLARQKRRPFLIQCRYRHPAWPMLPRPPQHRLLRQQSLRPLQRQAHACPRSPPLHCQPMRF